LGHQNARKNYFKKLFIASVILLASMSISFAGSTLNFKEGKWEITVKTEMEGP
jgi:hypothetical protein